MRITPSRGPSALHAAVLTAMFLIPILGTANASADAPTLSVRVTIPMDDCRITPSDTGDELAIPGFGRQPIVGKPNLPSKIFAIAIPPGAEVLDVRCETGAEIDLPGMYRVPPTQPARVIGEEKPEFAAARQAEYEANYAAVYGSDVAYPEQVVEFVGSAGFRKYNLVDVRVTPLAYRPQSGRLTQFESVTVQVDYAFPDRQVALLDDHLARQEQIAEDIVLNYEQAQQWYPPANSDGRGMYDFVIVTIDSLTASVQPLVDWEIAKGRTVQVVTLSWINANYGGGYDTAENIRNFLRDKYPMGAWGIEDVLLVGHYDQVPMRRVSQDIGYGDLETDFYYAELSLPDSQSWDSDHNHLYGGDEDTIDLYAEVNVGRIPWSAPATVQHICEKSVAYEQNTDPAFKKNILLLGAYFWDDDPRPKTDNAVLMEAKIDQPWMANWTKTRLYEQGYSTFPMDYDLTNSNVVSVWSAGKFAFVNWAGHGSPTSAHVYHGSRPAFIQSSNCASLNDDYPAIIFANACSNSDTNETNLGQSMLQRGAVGFVGATKVALGCPGWSNVLDGSSQSLDYYFTTCVTSGEYAQGAAHQYGLRQMYVNGLWDHNRYETFEWGALWGNPDLALQTEPPPLVMSLVGALPEYIAPGVPMEFAVRIYDRGETYVPGSGLLHYRFDGGPFLTTPLTLDTGNTFIATLPGAHCDDVPEFYVSAAGDGGSTVTLPDDAPDELYSAIIGHCEVVFSDNFETNTGWTVQNSPSLTAGAWERGVPVGGGVRGDPQRDYDGSGKCYLTGNASGDSDIDGGTTWLISPPLDLGGGDAEIHYALWYTNNFGGDPNNDLFKTYISNDNGANWTLAETIGPESTFGWNVHVFTVSDFVTPNASIKVRFEASDLNSGSIVEAGIDAFQIIRLICEEPHPCFGDLDGDNDVDLTDLATLLAHYGDAGVAYEDGDLDEDGDVDLRDLAALLGVYHHPC